MRLSDLDKGPALFLDDEREPPRSGHDWKVVRNADQAKRYIIEHGLPKHMSFDHDLGEGENGYDLVKWLVEYDMNYNVIPTDFTFAVHSQNPIGAANIKCFLRNYLDLKQ